MRKGSGVLVGAVVGAVLVGIMSYSVARLHQASYSGLNASKQNLQAMSYAESECARLRTVAYSELKDYPRSSLGNNFEKEVILSDESVDGAVHKKTATVNVYWGGVHSSFSFP